MSTDMNEKSPSTAKDGDKIPQDKVRIGASDMSEA
jgi:hypothetical protein